MALKVSGRKTQGTETKEIVKEINTMAFSIRTPIKESHEVKKRKDGWTKKEKSWQNMATNEKIDEILKELSIMHGLHEEPE